jgi:hypothetical protein
VTLEELLSEATRLARPCGHLRFTSGTEPVCGYWHGLRAGELCASIERRSSWLNVYLDEECQSGRVEVSTAPVLSERPLYRTDATSLPPIDAVFRFGSDAIDKYLKANGWERSWGFNNNFKGAAAHDYEHHWAKQCPLYSGGVVAVEGGWNVPWPEDDWEDLLSHELVLWTFEESEPWVEVFAKGNEFLVFQRIT